MWWEVTLVIIAYCIGSINTAKLLCAAWHLPDPATAGSKNPGATNMYRLHGKKLGVLTLTGDFLKAALPLSLIVMLGFPEWIKLGVGTGLFFGHLFPIYYQFKGGKGVATLFCILPFFHWIIGLVYALIWLISVKLLKKSSAGAICASFFSLIIIWLVSASIATKVMIAIMLLVVLLRHHQNIIRILQRREL